MNFVFRRVRKIAGNECWLRNVRLSVRLEQLGSHWKCFHETRHFPTFRKSVEKIPVSLQSERNNNTALYVQTDILCTL